MKPFKIYDPKCNFCCVAFQHSPSPELCEGCCCHLVDKKYVRGTQEFIDNIKNEIDKKLIHYDYPNGNYDLIDRGDIRCYTH